MHQLNLEVFCYSLHLTGCNYYLKRLEVTDSLWHEELNVYPFLHARLKVKSKIEGIVGQEHCFIDHLEADVL